MSVQGDASVWNETQGECPTKCVHVHVRVCVCVFLSLCRSLELLSVLLRQLVTGLSPPAVLSVSLYLSLSFAFFPLYSPPSTLYFLPSNPSLTYLFSAALFFHSISPISSSALWREPIHISHLTQYWAWKSHFSLTEWRNLSAGEIIPLVSNANQFALRIFPSSSATLQVWHEWRDAPSPTIHDKAFISKSFIT